MAFATIATIASLGLQGLSTWLSARNQRKSQAASDANYAREQAYAEMMANRNPLSTNGNRALLAEYDRSAKKQIDAARNTAQITGATPEYSLGVQQAVAEGRAQTMSGIAREGAANEEKWLAAAEQSRQNQHTENQQRAAAKEESFANMAANAVSGLGSILSGIDAKNTGTGVDGGSGSGTNSTTPGASKVKKNTSTAVAGPSNSSGIALSNTQPLSDDVYRRKGGWYAS